MTRAGGLGRARVRGFVDELRPRFLVLRLRTRGVDFRWAVPSWAIEEVLRFAVRLAPALPAVVALARGRNAAERRVRSTGVARAPGGSRRSSVLALIAAFAAEPHRRLLALPAGEPLIAIETAELTLEVEQVALGARA